MVVVAVRLAPRAEVEHAEVLTLGDDDVALVAERVEPGEALEGDVREQLGARRVEHHDAAVVGEGEAGVRREASPASPARVLREVWTFAARGRAVGSVVAVRAEAPLVGSEVAWPPQPARTTHVGRDPGAVGDLATVPAPTTRPGSAAALLPLVLGGVGIGTTEFVTMGLLPEIADGIGVSIPQAGHAISAYALGVVVGAPGIALLGARLPRRAVLVTLMALFAVANAATATASGYGWLVLDRFLTGLPHGAFFGVASIVAHDLARPGLGGRAVSRVMLGIPIANVLGVPLATWVGQQAGWRAAYAVIAALGVLAAAGVAALVPHQPPDLDAHPRRELAALADVQVWLTLLVGAIGFGGSFAMYSYIAPILRHQTGLPADVVPVYLLVYGVGGLLGTLLAGRLVDRSVLRTLVGSSLACGLLLAVFAVAADHPVSAAVVLFLVCVAISAFVLSLQLRLMSVAGAARTIGAAGNHAALNIANALGAWLGGLVLAAGWGWRAPSLVGAGLSAAGLVVLALSVAVERRRRLAPIS